MFKHLLKRKTLNQAVYDQRWTWLVRNNTDIGSISTWDSSLSRNRRILIPVDVQAYVADSESTETLVPVTGSADDPAPFADGAKPAAGIHLHWAMPDALLRGEESSAGGELEMTELPDRWVVIRTLFPVGLNRPMLRGWVIDAKKASVMPLNEFSGNTADSNAETTFDRLDGTVGGSPLWTASYTASAGRFGFHDTLDDLAELRKTAKQGFDRDAATYVVAGWSSDNSSDPLNVRGKTELFDLLDELGWHLDPEADDSTTQPGLPVLDRLRDSGQFDQPEESTQTEIVARGRRESFIYADISPQLSLPIDNPSKIVIAQKPPRFLSLLHGMVTGVPIGTPPSNVDDRPGESALSVAIGYDTDDLVTALGSNTLGTSLNQRRASEMIAAAFTSDLIDRLGSPDGMRDIAEREHSDTFRSLPGKPLAASKADELRVEDSASTNATSLGRKGRAAMSKRGLEGSINTSIQWRDKVVFAKKGAAPKASAFAEEKPVPKSITQQRRSVERPAPRIFIPQAPVVAVKGARPSLRHHFDGLYDDEGRLRCRFPAEAIKAIKGVVDAADLVPTLGSGALPEEVLTVVREAVILNPYCSRWLAASSAKEEEHIAQHQARIQAEMLRLFSPDGRYDGTGEYTLSMPELNPQAATPRASAGEAWKQVSAYQSSVLKQAAAELSKASYLVGLSPSPLGVTTWRQPWAPLWLEWRIELEGVSEAEGWKLDDLEIESRQINDGQHTRIEYSGRSPIGRGLSTALHTSIERWIQAEQERDATEAVLDSSQQSSLENLANFLEPLDLASASLDGIREQLLGLDYMGGHHSGVDEDDRPRATKDPVVLFGGSLQLLRLRLVDAFGRTLEVPVSNVLTTTTLEIEDKPSSITMPLRLQNGARWLFRLVDPAYKGDPASAPEAYINQLEPELAVNPVAGFLLPDHIDESLECFDIDGSPIGQICHHEITGAVRWEPAPGRPVPPGSGPMLDLKPSAIPIGEIAAGVVRSDVQDRASDSPNPESSLSALLRAIDTTLWTVDTYSSLGSSSVAGLVGRPIAVVKATLRLDAPDDLDDVNITAPGGADQRRSAFDALRDQVFPVRLGDLQRSDDSLLGFYVNDDYDRFHLVDRVVAATARNSGRRRGQLGLLGQVSIPDTLLISHPIFIDEDTLYIRPGQVIKLTLLMLPAGRVHLTSGILPRKSLSLNDAWVGKGLNRVIPSVRVGPVLVDPEEIRLPKVHLLGDKQQFTRRTGPLTWRDDPIVSASQSALLPRMPHEFQEGWIMISDGDD